VFLARLVVDAMATGYVDENWARQHHSVWAAEQIADIGHSEAELAAAGTNSGSVTNNIASRQIERGTP
jgi:hypothetical protein